MDNCCQNCVYWVRLSGYPVGHCKRKAPTIGRVSVKWPVTGDRDWCGEFVATPLTVSAAFENFRKAVVQVVKEIKGGT